jgi:hypothetical protein
MRSSSGAWLRHPKRYLALLALPCLVAVLAAAVPARAAALRPGLPQAGSSLTVSLSVSQTTLAVGSSATLTATASEDVGPTPYWIEIFNASGGYLLAACGYGTTCTTTVQVNEPSPQVLSLDQEYVAYVSAYSTAFPPSTIQATSPGVYVTWSNLGYRLALSLTGLIPYDVSATASPALSPGFFIQIDEENGLGLEPLATCPPGSGSCTLSFTPNPAGSTLVAFIISNAVARQVVASSSIVTTRRFVAVGP